MNMRHMRRRLPAAMISACVVHTAASAQATEAPAAPPSESTTTATPNAPTSGLAEVVVTAQKVRQNLQKASISTTVVNGDEIRQKGMNKLDDIVEGVPGVVIQGQPRGAAVSVRGLGTDMPPGIGDGAVAINVDGAYNVRPEGSQVMYDLSRVEVLRGPQSTLYGRSGPAGVVNILTNDPTFVPAAAATVELGTYSLRRFEGMVNRPLSDTLALRVAVSSVDRKGYLNNGTNDADSKSGRLKLLYKPSEDLSAQVGAEFTRLGGHGTGYIPAFAGNSVDNAFDTANPAPGQSETFYSRKLWTQLDLSTAAGRLYGFLSTNSARSNQYLPTGASFRDDIGRDPSDLTQNTGELRLSTDYGNGLRSLAGLYYYDNDITVEQTALTGPNANRTITQHTTAKSMAAFGNLTYAMTSQSRLLAGLRHSSDDKTYYSNRNTPGQDSTGTWRHTDWKLGLEHDFGKQTMGYATVSTGYRPGTWKLVSPYPEVQAETLRAYELGWKTQAADNSWRLNTSLFYYDYRNYQVQDFYFNPAPTLEFINAAKASNKGGEVEGLWRPTERDLLGLRLGYIDAKFHSDVTLHPDGAGVINLNGRVQPHAPKWTIGTYAQHTFEFDSGASLAARLDAKYTSDQYVSSNEQALSLQEAYWMGDASLTWRPATGDWSLSAYVKNLTNQFVKTYYTLGYLRAGTPRTAGVVWSKSF